MACLPSDVVCALTTQGWEPLAITALLTSIFILVIAYMIGKGFHIPRLEAWAKLEYREVLFSGVLIAGLVFGITFINVLNAQFGPPLPPDGLSDSCLRLEGSVFQSACAHLDGSADNMMSIYRQLTTADRFIAKISSFYYNVAVPLFLATATVSQSPKGGVSILSMMIAAGLDALATSVFMQMAQKVLLEFFNYNSFRWLLPIGIVLRTLSLTRRLGATLIAIAIATYVVYPLTIVFAAHVYAQLAAPIVLDFPAEPPDLQDTLICNPYVQNFMQLGSVAWWFTWFSGPCSAATYGWWACMLAHFPAAQSMYSASNSIFLLSAAPALLQYASIDLDDVYLPVQDVALPAVATNAMLTAVLAVFSIILTVSAARALSAELGGDTQFYGIYKLI